MTETASLSRGAASPLNVFRASNFAPAFFFLPAERRTALQALYAYCRAVDDAVDQEPDAAVAQEILGEWRALLTGTGGVPGPRIDVRTWNALRDAIERYGVDIKHLLDVIDGVAMDLTRTRYESFDDLLKYCYGVASAVGLACLPVFGLKEEEHRSFAIDLGYAVQLTNILRDVGADALQGRIYLPREDLKRFGCDEDDIFARTLTPALRCLLSFEAARARDLYAKALSALPRASRRGARPALVMGAVYRSLLDKLERAGFPVFGDRVRLSVYEKLKSVAGVLRKEWVS